jgi:hypothetical protein
MSSPFQWSGEPSQIGQSFITRRPIKAPSLAPKRLHVFTAASSADAEREVEIAQLNREVEHHYFNAQTADQDHLKTYHRDEARRLAAKVRDLVGKRSLAYIRQLESERGLA